MEVAGGLDLHDPDGDDSDDSVVCLGEGEPEPDAVPPIRRADLSGVGLVEVAGPSPLVKSPSLAKMKHNRFGRSLPPMVSS